MTIFYNINLFLTNNSGFKLFPENLQHYTNMYINRFDKIGEIRR